MIKEFKIDKKDLLVMNLVHYFMIEEDYNPVVVQGINDEIWLENMQNEYKIIRIVSHYIHNNEQLNFDRFKTKKIVSKLKTKTLSLKMNVLNIYTDLGDNVNLDGNDKFMDIFINKIKDINNKDLISIFPSIVEKTSHKEKGVDLFMKITDDINKTNYEKGIKVGKLFSTKKPVVTYLLILICLIMLILTGASSNIYTLIKYGANVDYLTKGGEYYRLVSSIFLHVGIFHFLFNMYALYIIGPQIESFYGRFKYFLIFILSGISGSILSISFNTNTVSAGASGAIFGLMGALLYFGYYYRNYLGSVIKSQIIPIILLNLVIGFSFSGIDNAAHIGGLVGGVLSAMALGIKDKSRKFDKINNFIVLILYFIFIVYLCFYR